MTNEGTNLFIFNSTGVPLAGLTHWEEDLNLYAFSFRFLRILSAIPQIHLKPPAVIRRPVSLLLWKDGRHPCLCSQTL